MADGGAEALKGLAEFDGDKTIIGTLVDRAKQRPLRQSDEDDKAREASKIIM